MNVNFDFDDANRKYEALTVRHANQNAALRRAEYLLTMCPSVNFVIVAGPTGAGKTHLLRALEASINKSYRSQIAKEPSMLPCISTLTVADGARKFGWLRYWRDTLEALGDPFANSRPECGIHDQPHLYEGERLGTSRLRLQVERELRLRKTKVWIVDEAQHMLLGGNAGQPGDQFDVLKSVAQKTGVKIVLCGTYQLPSLLSYSGQVMRRSATVNLRRYDLSRKEDLVELASVAKSLLQSLPLEGYPDPKKHCQEFYYGTLGCVGVLKDWIAKAWALAHFEGAKTLTVQHLAETRLPTETLIAMNEEILAGEAQGSNELERRYHAAVLGRIAKAAKTEKTPPRRKRPGTRNPHRDFVGTRSKPQLGEREVA